MIKLEDVKREIHNAVQTEYIQGGTRVEIGGILIQWKKPKGEISQKEREKKAKIEADLVIACLYENN
jgi:hypothetical protein